MKMIISDYDGTIKRFTEKPSLLENIDLKKDVNSISNFIKKGNKFVISTKRVTSSILEEIKQYKIDYNYLISHGGLVSFDKNGKLLYANYLEEKLINFLKEINYKTDMIKQIDCFDAYNNTSFDKKDYILIGLVVKDIKEMLKKIKQIQAEINIHCSYNIKKNKIWLHNEVSKNEGITNLLQNIPETLKQKDIITIGDSINDLSMINEYDGYCIENGEIDKYYIGKVKSIPNIRKLIRKIK